MELTTATRPRSRRRRTKSASDEWTITLASGGTLTLSATLDLFSITAEDRALVFAIVDMMREHASAAPPV